MRADTVFFMQLGRLLWRRMTDLVIGAFLVGTQIEAWTQAGAHAPHWEVSLFAAGVVLPLALYRWAPLVAPMLTFGVLVLAATVNGQMVDHVVGFLFAYLAAMWLAGLYNETSNALAALVAGLAGVIYIMRQFPPNDRSAGGYVFSTAFGAAAWFAGFAIGFRSRQTFALRERAEQLEREREDQAARAVAEERRRIARELHDVVAHSVSVMVVQTAGVRRLLQPDQEREREALETVEYTGRQALAEMRRLLGVLRREGERPELEPQPGLGAIDSLIGQVRDAGLPVELEVDGDAVDLPPGIDLAAYRIVQEALTNVLRHAGPAHAWVSVHYAPEELELTISNDGKAEMDDEGTRYGLVGMKERVNLYGGRIEAGPRQDGRGFSVCARLPLETAR